MDNTQLVEQLRSVTHIYIGLRHADRALQQLKSRHETTPLAATALQQQTAAIERELEVCVTQNKASFENDDTNSLELINAITNSIQSFQRYMVKQIHGVVL
ncbi:MAG: hypothetical protein COB66_08310 [Coxiella sp. (in: Bacteria)]|nr:MAG: hypothetical protein COB66_08310 [Coxiella sp. (in: g-proteobacteria)]